MYPLQLQGALHITCQGHSCTGVRFITPSAPNSELLTVFEVHDEGVKNLMMSWYYAGYYTGLYEGRKQSSSNATNGSGSERTDK